MTGLALMALLLTTPAQVEVRSQHQLVSVDGKTWRWVRPGVPLSLDVKREGKQRLAVELIRVGTPGAERKSERVDVRLGKQRKPVRLKLKLQGSRAVPGQGSLRMSYSVRHRFRLPSGKTTVKISTSAKQSPFGVLVRASLSKPKAVPDEGGLALAPLGALPPADAADKPTKRKRRRSKRRRSRRGDRGDKRADKSADTRADKPADKPGRPSKEEGKPATPPGPAAASAAAPAATSPAATSTDARPRTDDGKPATTAQPPPSETPAEPVTRPGPPTGADADTADPNKASMTGAASAGDGAASAPPAPAPAAEAPPPPGAGREGREAREREDAERAEPTVEHRPERPTDEPASPAPTAPTVEHRPERPTDQPLPPDAPTESVEVIELVPQEPRALLGPRQLGTGVPLLVEAQLSPGLIVQPLGGLSNVATSGGLRLLFGVNLGFFSRFTYGAGVDIDYQAAATTPGSAAASVRWQTGQMRLRLEGAFDVLRLDISDFGRLHVGVLGGVGAILGAHWLSQGTDVVTHPMIGPTARLGLTGGFTVGPGSVTLSLPVDWSYGVGAVAGYAPLAGTFFLGYRLEL